MTEQRNGRIQAPGSMPFPVPAWYEQYQLVRLVVAGVVFYVASKIMVLVGLGDIAYMVAGLALLATVTQFDWQTLWFRFARNVMGLV